MRLSTVILPSERWSENRPKWIEAERLGLHAAYTYDHLSWRSFRERPWFTMVPFLAAASQVTSSIRLGPLVTTPNFRHPLLLAKDLLALDDVSNGRLVVGVGAGGQGFDASVLGHEPWSDRERFARYQEFTLTLERLLREPATSVKGEYYSVQDSRQLPGPVQRPRPPLYLSGLRRRSIAFAAEVGDGWVSVGAFSDAGDSTEVAVERQSQLLDDALGELGRTGPYERLFLGPQTDEAPLGSYEGFLDWAGRYRELKITELVIHYPIPDSIFDYDHGLFERIATEGRDVLESWS